MADTNTTFTPEEEALIAKGESFGGFTQRPIGIGQYPYVTVDQTQSGHMEIKDETPGSEKLVEIHRSGTYTTIFPDGSQENKIVGRNVVIVEKDNNVTITGACNITIHGDSNIEVIGNKLERIKGNYTLEVQGDFTTTVIGESSTSVGSDASFIVSPNGLGKFRLLTGQAGSTFDTSLNVLGEIQAASISSDTMVSAGTGIIAGIPGAVPLRPGAEFTGIRTLGGITVGAMTPSEPGAVNAVTSVKSPLIAGVITTDIRGPMELIRQQFNTHIHPTPKGPSGPPIPLM